MKHSKTPFIIALNKIDLIEGFVVKDDLIDKSLIENLNAQSFEVQQKIEGKLYETVAFIQEKFGMESERFDRCDFTKQIAIVPCSAKTGVGIPKLLMIITALTQKYLGDNLQCDISDKKSSKGTILEIKNVEGLGLCMDAIIYDGMMRVNDILIIGGLEHPIETKIKGLFEPDTLTDMRDKKTKFNSMREVIAATGVRISAPEIENVIAGMPIISCIQSTAENQLEDYRKQVQKQVDEVIIETEKEGIVVKADTIGSLEAMIRLLRDKKIRIRKASVGNVTKKDLADAESNFDRHPLESAILAFNVNIDPNIRNDKVKVIRSNIIYKLIDEYSEWKQTELKRLEQKELEGLTRPCKIEYLHNYTFRSNNPAVIGVEVLIGELQPNTQLMKNDGIVLATVKEIQKDKESVRSIKKKDQAAISLPGVTVGRQIAEGDIFYSAIHEEQFRKLKTLTKYFSKEEISLLKEIADMMRVKNPVWGV